MSNPKHNFVIQMEKSNQYKTKQVDISTLVKNLLSKFIPSLTNFNNNFNLDSIIKQLGIDKQDIMNFANQFGYSNAETEAILQNYKPDTTPVAATASTSDSVSDILQRIINEPRASSPTSLPTFMTKALDPIDKNNFITKNCKDDHCSPRNHKKMEVSPLSIYAFPVVSGNNGFTSMNDTKSSFSSRSVATINQNTIARPTPFAIKKTTTLKEEFSNLLDVVLKNPMLVSKVKPVLDRYKIPATDKMTIITNVEKVTTGKPEVYFQASCDIIQALGNPPEIQTLVTSGKVDNHLKICKLKSQNASTSEIIRNIFKDV